MPYSHITRTAFGADAIAYARGDGTGHNGAEVRNEYTAGVNMLPDEVIPFEQQMRPFWERAHFRHTIQVDRLIVSFHPSELDPDKPEDCVMGLAIGCEIAKRNAPDNQSAVFLQKDGKGGKIHLHIITNDVNMSDCKGINPAAYAHFHFQKIVDEVCQQYFDLKETEAQPEKVNHAVRGARMKNEQIRAANALEMQKAAEEGRKIDPKKIKTEQYIWLDDLRQKVKEAAARATDEDSFAHQLRLSGVELVPHKHKDDTVTYLHPATKKQPAHYTYELTDTSGFTGKIRPNLRSKSYKLGTNYQPEAIAKLFGTATPSIQVAPDLDDDQEHEAPLVFFEPPHPQKPKKDTEKPTQETPPAKKDAKDTAQWYALALMRQIYGWPDKPPKITGPDGREYKDYEEIHRQYQERDAAFDQFTQWRTVRMKELEKIGEKLSPIYNTDKETGYVSVPRVEFERQFSEFLDRRDHPEKYVATQEQPEQAAPVEHGQKERQQPAPVGPPPAKQQQVKQEKPSPAEQERQEVETQHSVFFEEMQRVLAENRRRWKEDEEGQEEDTEKLP